MLGQFPHLLRVASGDVPGVQLVADRIEQAPDREPRHLTQLIIPRWRHARHPDRVVPDFRILLLARARV